VKYPESFEEFEQITKGTEGSILLINLLVGANNYDITNCLLEVGTPFDYMTVDYKSTHQSSFEIYDNGSLSAAVDGEGNMVSTSIYYVNHIKVDYAEVMKRGKLNLEIVANDFNKMLNYIIQLDDITVSGWESKYKITKKDLSFITKNPGTQFSGSFKHSNISWDDWTKSISP